MSTTAGAVKVHRTVLTGGPIHHGRLNSAEVGLLQALYVFWGGRQDHMKAERQSAPPHIIVAQADLSLRYVQAMDQLTVLSRS
jgi:hypothetical protein